MTQAGEGAATLEAAERRVGQELGTSGWLVVDQARIDAHATTTGDADFLHNDPRARPARDRSAAPSPRARCCSRYWSAS
jgi:acyl dehydratase